MTEQYVWNPTQTLEQSGVYVNTEDGTAFGGWATLSEPGIVCVAFPEGSAPLLATYQTVDMCFTGYHGELSLPLESVRLFHCQIVPGQITYVFEVEKQEWRTLRESLSPRRAARIEPECMVAVNLTTPEGNARGTIEDISQTGLCLRVKPADEKFFLHPGPLALKFQVPGDRGFLLMIGRPRYRTRDANSGHVRCGFEFDGSATEGFAEQCARIASYIAGRTGSEDDGAWISMEVGAAPIAPIAPAAPSVGAAPRTPAGKFVREEALPVDESPAASTPQAPTPAPAPHAEPEPGGFRVVRRDSA